MALSNRHRYKSRREKMEQNSRNMKVVTIFVLLAAVVLIYKNRWPIYDWIRVYFY